MGRVDAQVKVKGYRIEPREVEECLASYDDPEQAVVVVDADAVGERRLVSYLLARDGTALPDAGELKTFGRRRLPSTWSRPSSRAWTAWRSTPTASWTAARCRR
ncbi:MAG: hypothetical protein QOK49_2177 [Baekduia sp.]|nr:hypothetical protein [Baekduia sp.]MEA2481033.1 hypothetical protein [Thermoleophilaceae bacterium]